MKPARSLPRYRAVLEEVQPHWVSAIAAALGTAASVYGAERSAAANRMGAAAKAQPGAAPGGGSYTPTSQQAIQNAGSMKISDIPGMKDLAGMPEGGGSNVPIPDAAGLSPTSAPSAQVAPASTGGAVNSGPVASNTKEYAPPANAATGSSPSASSDKPDVDPASQGASDINQMTAAGQKWDTDTPSAGGGFNAQEYGDLGRSLSGLYSSIASGRPYRQPYPPQAVGMGGWSPTALRLAEIFGRGR